MDQPWLWVLAVAAVAAMAVWARSARFRQRQLRRTEAGGGDPDLVALVRSDLRKDTLAAAMWGLVAVTAVIMSFRSTTNATVLLLVLIVPANADDPNLPGDYQTFTTELARRATCEVVLTRVVPA